MDFSWLVFIVIGLYLLNCVKILAEYERGVVFRLGRVLPRPKGPGLVLVFAPIDRIVRMSLRVETMEVPPQDVVTRDNVTVKVSAVVFFRVIEPQKAVIEVAHYVHATSQLAQTRLRSVLGEADLDELLSHREMLNARLQETLDEHTGPWGIKVQAVEVKQVDLPEQMIRAIARQAEAERERRAKIIHAEGELQASAKLSEAAEMLSRQPTSVTLRYLQTLTEIGAEKNTTIIFPLPLDLYRGMAAWADDLVDKRVAGGKPEDKPHAT
jgi:regulator of protease activity HflC (stomatin/prohibitin superfamily)